MREVGREVRVTLTGAGINPGLSLVVADYSSEREDRGLDVSFRITRHSRLEPQESEITVWGLSAPTRDRIARAVEDAREQSYATSQFLRSGVVAISAGRPGRAAELCADVITDTPTSERDGSDWRTTIRAADGRLPWAYARISETRSSTVDPIQVAQQAQAALGLQAEQAGATLAEFAPDLVARGFTGYAGGLSLFGDFVDQNAAIMGRLGLRQRFSRGQLVWFRDTTAEIVPAIELVEGSTLLSLDPPIAFGYRKARAMLNPALEIGRQIFLRLASGSRLGPYRIDEATYTGGTREAAWYADLLLRPTSL